jgi:hypothetical protein
LDLCDVIVKTVAGPELYGPQSLRIGHRTA